ncbi:hypothetical protein [Herbiconiux sp. YIM B11900]|uniref:hypothetical protein n=1 Tax=Herbiconiux sp. YIM B11900 TaxID=3404131 RepID=UPI003F841868
MTTPGSRAGKGFALVGRIVAGVAAAAVGAVFVLSAWMAVSSRFGLTDGDVHGYGLIFGTVLAVVAGFVTALLLPLAFPRRLWGRVLRAGLACFGVLLVLLIVSLVTA